MNDSCVISREQLSLREKDLKAKLFGTKTNGFQPTVPMPKSYTDEMAEKKRKRHVAETQPSEYLYKPPAATASMVGLEQSQLKKMTQNQEQKMGTFIDEMRQNFLQTQNANQVPQSLMYRQTQMMDRQIDVLEKNQKQIGDIICNLMNQGATGPESSGNVKQNVFNENRRMMLEMMAPINQQLNEMKLLYENTKSASSDVGGKIDELKKVITLQQNSLKGGSTSGGSNPFITGGMNQDLMENFLDPQVIRKGMDEIKEQMREVQREAHLIEGEMDSRFKHMVSQNQAKMSGMPMSLTQELEAQDQREKSLTDQVSKVPSYNRTRDLIIERLGGPFDYGQFGEDIRQLKVERDQLKRQFKREQLFAPELKSEDFGGKKAYYDFSTRPLVQDQQSTQSSQDQTQVSYEKPSYLANIVSEPPKFMLQEEFEIPQPKPQVQFQQPKQQQPQFEAPIQAIPIIQPQQPIIQRSPSPPAPKLDILALKKQVMEEIRQELQEEAREKERMAERAEQALQAQRARDLDRGAGQIFPTESNMRTQMTGEKPKELQDNQSKILNALRESQTTQHNNINDFMRQSIKSLQASENQSFNESAIAGALAEYYLQDQNVNKSIDIGSVGSQDLKNIGEDLIIQKLNKIFDEMQKDNQEFEESYTSLKGPKKTQSSDIEASMGDTKKKVTIVEEVPQPSTSIPVAQSVNASYSYQQPMVVPVVINQQSQNEFGGQYQASQNAWNPNQLRDIVQQAVSQQLQLHNIRTDNFEKSMATNKSYDSNRTTQTMKDEEAKLKCEMQLLNRQIPVNVHPSIIQNLGIAPGPTTQPGSNYVNPFSAMSNMANAPVPNGANIYNIKPPLIGELAGFDLGGDLDSDSDFINFEDSYRRRRKEINILDDRSDGELGPNIGLGESIGELDPHKFAGERPLNMNAIASKPKGVQRYGKSPVKDKRPLGQTIDFEGGLEGSNSNYTEDFNDSKFEDLQKPIYDSKEDPIPKMKSKNKPSNNVFVSGESFGNKNPLNRSSGQMPKNGGFREQIAEDFLEDDDVQESGEINPSMFNK